MRLARIVLIVGISGLLLAGCSRLQHQTIEPAKVSEKAASVNEQRASASFSDGIITNEGGRNSQFDQASTPDKSIPKLTPVSFTSAEEQSAQYARKIIRNGELTIQTKSPETAQHNLEAVAESFGGFVVSSELTNTPQAEGASDTGVTIVMRIPSSRFPDAIAAITKLDGRILNEKITGEDVTQEYVDLDARLKSKRALEAQFLEIMKQAHKVEDALDVQEKLGEVRTEIEQIEGRQRYLENQSALSTITVHLRSTAPVITATKTGFLQSISLAFGDCIDTGAAIINGFIRFLGVLIPVTILIFLPIALILRYFIRRYWPSKPAAESVAGEA